MELQLYRGMYRYGLGVPRDRAKAIAWYRRGAACDNAESSQGAREILETLRTGEEF